MKIIVDKHFKYILDKEQFIRFIDYINLNPDSLNEIKELPAKDIHQKTIDQNQKIQKICNSIFGSSLNPDRITQGINLYLFLLREISGSLKYNILRNDRIGIKMRKDIAKLLREYHREIKPAVVYSVFAGNRTSEGICSEDGKLKLTGKSLHRFFKHNSETTFPLIIYVVTIGYGIDRQVKILSAESGNVYNAYILNAIGAGFTDAVALDLQLYLSDIYKSSLGDMKLLRVSPGYADWKLSDQKAIFDTLNPQGNIGVTINESFLMTPLKSTSGLMGPVKKKGSENEH